MHEWIHICSDIDNGQDIKKAINFLFVILLVFNLLKNTNWDCNFHASEQHSTTILQHHSFVFKTNDLKKLCVDKNPKHTNNTKRHISSMESTSTPKKHQ
jgi:hypothetical protein